MTVSEAKLFADVVDGAFEVGSVTPDDNVFDEPTDEAIEAADVDFDTVADEAETGAGDEPGTTDTEGLMEAAEDVPATAVEVAEDGQADIPDVPSNDASAERADALALASAVLLSLSAPLMDGSGPTTPSEENCVAIYVALSGIYVVLGLS